MIKTELPKLSDYYHQIPFKEYEPMTAKRMDGKARWNAIRESCGDVTDKSLLDFGCAEGFFMWSFMQDGGRCALGVEINDKRKDFINALASNKDLDVTCISRLDDMRLKFDIALFLDLWHDDNEPGIPSIATMKSLCDTLFVSPCRSGNEYNPKLEKVLKQEFSSVKEIYQGYESRKIYQCS